MKNFTTNLTLEDSLDSKQKSTESTESKVFSKAIQDKIKLIEKAFC